MKQLTTYNRVAGYMNKIFDLLNEHYFQGELARPTITIQSTPKAYGHFSTRPDTWVSVTGNSFELNLGAGTIGRPIEEVCATVLHETVHYYCTLRQEVGHWGLNVSGLFRDYSAHWPIYRTISHSYS